MSGRDPRRSVCRFRWNYPLVNFQVGEVKTCCHTPGRMIFDEELNNLGKDTFLNTDYQIERRKEMIEGIRHPDCVYCWDMEDNNIPSPRHGGEQFTHYFKQLKVGETFDSIIEKIQKEPQHLRSSTPYLIELRFGNRCDLKCVYCNEHYSTAWEAEKKQFDEGVFFKPMAPTNFEKYFWEWFEETHESLEFISFIGGEPTLYEEFYSTMDRLQELYRKKPHLKKPNIGLITNLNSNDVYFGKLLKGLPKWTQTFHVMIFASVDTVGTRAEYLRTGLNWLRFQKNTEALLALPEKNFSFTINPTINCLSLNTMLELIQWTVEVQRRYGRPIGLGRNMVVEPKYFSPLVLPKRYHQKIAEVIEFLQSVPGDWREQGYHGRWDMYCDFLGGIEKSLRESEDGVEKLKQWVLLRDNLVRLDKKRKTSFSTTFPELDFFI